MNAKKRAAESAQCPEGLVMRLEIKVTSTLIQILERKASEEELPAGRVAAKLLAAALGLNEKEGLPPYKPAGRPRKSLARSA
jgi:hypothetical protein